jgi:crossover junction endodeoxyribonuclease RuvC
MRIVGLDPGIRATGLAVVDIGGPHPGVIRCATIRSTSGTVAERLDFIASRIQQEIHDAGPYVVGIEDQRGAMIGASLRGKNTASSVSKTASVVGIVHGIVSVTGAALITVTPAQAKRAVGLNARATKAQVKRAVQVLTGSISRRSEHAADAVAIAVAAERIHRRVFPAYQRKVSGR